MTRRKRRKFPSTTTENGVLFGYGDRTEMEECHAAYIAESVNELRKMLVS